MSFGPKISEAQQRSWVGRIRENLSPTQYLKERVSSKYYKQMESIRAADRSARSIAVKNNALLKEAEKYINKKELLKAFGAISELYRNYQKFMAAFSDIVRLRKTDLPKFYFDSDAKTQKRIQETVEGLPPNWSAKKSASFEKTAFLSYLARTVEDAIYSAIFGDQLAEKKKAIIELVEFAKETNESINEALKLLEEDLITGNVGQYLLNSKSVDANIGRFFNQYKNVYNNYVKEMLAASPEGSSQVQQGISASKESLNKEIPAATAPAAAAPVAATLPAADKSSITADKSSITADKSSITADQEPTDYNADYEDKSKPSPEPIEPTPAPAPAPAAPVQTNLEEDLKAKLETATPIQEPTVKDTSKKKTPKAKAKNVAEAAEKAAIKVLEGADESKISSAVFKINLIKG